jgi:putative flavoprotein involved in K+ transport
MERIETLIIGGGQAGLAVSYFLLLQRREHLILEKSTRPAHVWTDDRWDSFTIVTPNWAMRMPGAEYNGNDPGGYMPRSEVGTYFDQYVKNYKLPIRYGTCVTSVEQLPDGKGFQVITDQGSYRAKNVVMATGLFQQPKIPKYAAEIPINIVQLHSGHYRNPESLPPGAVLVVGSGQSGCQIAEELYQSGRKVYLCVGSAGRAPRRYRGKDIFEWLLLTGFFDRTVDKLPSPRAKFAGNPQVSGKNGGHTLNVHQFARDGVQLLGRIAAAKDGRITLSSGLHESLARVDKFEIDLTKQIDEYIQKTGVEAPGEIIPQLRDGYKVREFTELDLRSAGIKTIIWSAGYSFDYSMVKLPVTDGDGYPIQQRGVTQYQGLYFAGMPWLHKYKSGLLVGVGEHAEYVAAQIATGNKQMQPGM